MQPYILGIDLGSHSLGWAAIGQGLDDKPTGILAVGVRTFEAGVEASFDQLIQGKQKSKAAVRRSKRGTRRQTWRRAWRRYKVLKCLISHGLLCDPADPETCERLGLPAALNIRKPADQHTLLAQIDVHLRERLRPAVADPVARHRWELVWLYELRAAALDRKLDPLELGRALYHLAQRRGFLSNRKTDAPDDDEGKKKTSRQSAKSPNAGLAHETAEQSESEAQDKNVDPKIVKAAIEQLGKEMAAVNARTLGVYFARHVNPEESRIRGPGRWTSRSMYVDEFNAIWEAQKAHHPALLTDAFRRKLSDRDEPNSMFFQRPLKPTSHLVGHCQLEPDRKRALQAIPLAQRFRLLQKVNDLEVLEPNAARARPLTDDERKKLIHALSTEGDRTFKQIRKLLDFDEQKIDKDTGEIVVVGHVFNLERPPSKDIPGDRMAAKILACDKKSPGVSERWRSLTESQQEALALSLLDFTQPGPLANHLESRFGFTSEQARVLSTVKPEKSHCSLSRRAIVRLLPLMETGVRFATAKERIPEYRAREVRRGVALDFLPRVLATDRKHLPTGDGKHAFFMRPRDLPNPAVTRALAELRKVVNALIRKFGKPQAIHVELGRELKKSAKQREAITKQNAEHRLKREQARDCMPLDELIQIDEPTDADVMKWLLGQEQAWHCPYCCQPMERGGLRTGELQVDHVIPLSISHDNSVTNKVLCHSACNQRKGKRAPCHAFDKEQLQRIAIHTARLPASKRRRLQWTEEDIAAFYADDQGGFTRRQLQDTQYSSRLARDYLGMLYGGAIDEDNKQRVQVSSGMVTAILRREWDLNAIIPSLPDSPARSTRSGTRLEEKLRTDHRHHAVDAIVIALTTPSTIQELSIAASRVEDAERRRLELRDSQGRRRSRYAEMSPPWADWHAFHQAILAEIGSTTVSRRPERRVQGAIHAESLYSREIRARDGTTVRHIRKELHKLTLTEVMGDAIVDLKVRRLVQEKLNGLPPKKAFSDRSSHPKLVTRDGREIPIHKARILVKDRPWRIGRGVSGRHVLAAKGSNHHLEVVRRMTESGAETVDAWVVNREEVFRRKRDGMSIVCKQWPVGSRFAFSLNADDCVEISDPLGKSAIYRVAKFSQRSGMTGVADILFVLHSDARPDGDRDTDIRATSRVFWETHQVRKVTVTHLGIVLPAND